MDGVEGQIAEPGLRRVSPDELGRLAGERVGRVVETAHGFGTAKDRVGRIFCRVEEVVLASEEATKLTESPAAGMEGRGVAEVRLAEPAGGVARGLEAVAERSLRHGQPDRGRRAAGGAGVELVPEPLLVAAREQARPRGAAVRPADIAAGEPYAVGCEGIDVGRGDVAGVALAAELAVAEVVGEDHEHVWRTGDAAVADGGKHPLHFVDPVGMIGGQVQLLARVVAEVEQLILPRGVGGVFGSFLPRPRLERRSPDPLDQLPVAHAQGVGRVGPLHHHVIADWRTGLSLRESPQHADAVFCAARRPADAEDVGQRREHVDQPDHLFAHGAGGHVAGPADEERLAKAPLVDAVLARPQWSVDGQAGLDGPGDVAAVGIGDAAVVAGEHNERVVSDPEPIERVEQSAHAPVEFLDEVAEGAVAAGVEPRVGGDRPMHGVRGEVDEERLLAVGLDPVGGLCGEVFHDVIRLELLLEAGGAFGSDDNGLAGHAAEEFFVLDEAVGAVVGICRQSEEVVEAQGPRPRRERAVPVGSRHAFLQAEMPLPERRGAVALALAERGESGSIGLNVEWAVGEEHLAVFHAGPPVVAARHQPVAGRRADRSGGVGAREPPAFAGEPVDVGGLQTLCPAAGQAPPAEVVGEDDHDVGPACRRLIGPAGRRGDHTDRASEGGEKLTKTEGSHASGVQCMGRFEPAAAGDDYGKLTELPSLIAIRYSSTLSTASFGSLLPLGLMKWSMLSEMNRVELSKATAFTPPPRWRLLNERWVRLAVGSLMSRAGANDVG